ncbi:pyridoxal phosphate-dependent transferase [Mycotypha africana]|uniref:pyridoxal phosphate-dependent transferase n=1 Tax=Mycotypha africana TaxID=64632 RepID=UPI002300878B|nr:pyridoxal phosphate-dependent transferase [Mycotypha africana]KAI8991083.1 pyridoxal phosphate-dependent transferase [Mycotypha africana]
MHAYKRHVKTYNPSKLVKTKTLYTYPDPVSPHIATDQPPADAEVLRHVKLQMLQDVKSQTNPTFGSYYFLETAGGIHSPVMSGTPQVDFYRSLRLPTLLIGDSHLGGISTTLTSLESLHLRGYDVPAVLLFEQPHYRNHVLIGERYRKMTSDGGRGEGLVVTVPPPPPVNEADPVRDQASMKAYYQQLDEHLVPVIQHLDAYHEQRFERLETMAEKSRSIFWWPFTQHQTVKDVTVIDSAHQDHFTTYDGGQPKEMFDACASWWTQGLGHANPDLTLSAAHAAGRYGHVIFPESTHEPALRLAEKVLHKDTWASRVFFSDNGSTAMEVAMKMAFTARLGSPMQDSHNTQGKTAEILGIEGSYHGDTIGAMDACAPNVYNDQVHWYKPRGHWLKPPTVHISKGKPLIRIPSAILAAEGKETQHADASPTVKYYDTLDAIYSVDKVGVDRDAALATTYRTYILQELAMLKQQERSIGALLMEPVLMGAGGMMFVDPLFQRVLIDTVREEKDLFYEDPQRSAPPSSAMKGLPVIFDEVFSGWYRLGRRSASEFLGVKPDITAYAKTLTGGLLPLALTVTKESMYRHFLSNEKPDCLLHGHSYTAHPMGCAVASTSIDTLDRLASPNNAWTPFRQQWTPSPQNKTENERPVWSMWRPETVNELSHLDQVESVMTLGSVLAVELKDLQSKGYGSSVSASIIQKLRSAHYKNGLDGTPETGIHLFARPLGNVIYLMASQITTPERIQQCEMALLETLKQTSL